MQFLEHVPCADGQSHTSFGITVDPSGDGPLLVEFFVFENFALADMKWRQDLTNQASKQLSEGFPEREHIFSWR